MYNHAVCSLCMLTYHMSTYFRIVRFGTEQYAPCNHRLFEIGITHKFAKYCRVYWPPIQHHGTMDSTLCVRHFITKPHTSGYLISLARKQWMHVYTSEVPAILAAEWITLMSFRSSAIQGCPIVRSWQRVAGVIFAKSSRHATDTVKLVSSAGNKGW